jgi:hypothetical protein
MTQTYFRFKASPTRKGINKEKLKNVSPQSSLFMMILMLMKNLFYQFHTFANELTQNVSEFIEFLLLVPVYFNL